MAVVERRHDCLTGAGCRDQKVAVVTSFAGDRDQLEKSLLERLGAQLDRAEDDARPRIRVPGLALLLDRIDHGS